MPEPLNPNPEASAPDSAPLNPSPSSPESTPPKTQASAPDFEPTPLSLLASVQRERDELESRLLRVSADYQNYARRAQQNITEARQQAVRSVSRSLLGVLDHFDRALNVDLQKTSAQSLLDGLKIVRDELLRSLEQHGVRRIPVKPGDEFDPHLHEAVLHQTAQGVAPNHVTLELESGYLLDDFTLRPAKVAVAP